MLIPSHASPSQHNTTRNKVSRSRRISRIRQMLRQYNRLPLTNQIARMTVSLHVSIIDVRHCVAVIWIAEENCRFDLRSKGC